MIDKDIFLNLEVEQLPFDYKWLEFRLAINKKLYDDKIIDFKVFRLMEDSILKRLTKIFNDCKKKEG